VSEARRFDSSLGSDEAVSLYLGAILGDAMLAVELERLGLSNEAESFEDARLLRLEILEAVEAARRAAEGNAG
jgi:hypothetical protein